MTYRTSHKTIDKALKMRQAGLNRLAQTPLAENMIDHALNDPDNKHKRQILQTALTN